MVLTLGQLGVQLDVYKAQRENEEVRKQDAEQNASMLLEVLANERTMMRVWTQLPWDVSYVSTIYLVGTLCAQGSTARSSRFSAQGKLLPQHPHRSLLSMLQNLSRTSGRQRQILEDGVHMMEASCQGRRDNFEVPEEFVITSLEIVVHEHLKLGDGGFADVFEAEWNKTVVAVKLFPRGVPRTVSVKIACTVNIVYSLPRYLGPRA